MPWQDYDLKLVLAGEVITEEWRSLVAARCGVRRPLHDIASLYGTADAGVLGNETPLTVAVRRHASRRPELARALFGEARLPTLVQYDPHSRFFEVHDGTLVFTCDGPAPLVRYHLSDTGGLFAYDDLIDILARHGVDPFDELDRGDPSVVRLPFAYVFGRSHHAVSYYGANVFPEMVSVGLEQPGIAEQVTGKFVMSVREDADRNTHFGLVVELARGATPNATLRDRLAESIGEHVARLSSEYAAYVPPERRSPRVELRLLGDAEYFPIGREAPVDAPSGLMRASYRFSRMPPRLAAHLERRPGACPSSSIFTRLHPIAGRCSWLSTRTKHRSSRASSTSATRPPGPSS